MTKKTDQYVPINKGNYALDTDKRVVEFDRKLSTGWSEGYKDYRQQWTDRAKTQSIRDYPLLVDIELASICNLKCPMCYTISDTFRQAVNTTKMEWDLFAKIIDEIGGKVPAIRLSLRGEATLNKNFVECIRYAKSKGIKEVSTLTHGFKLNEKFTAEIIEAGIDWITISVDGLNETYNGIRKPLKFDDLFAKITALHNYKVANKLVKPVIKIQGIWPAIEKDINGYYEAFKGISDLVAFNPLIDYLAKDESIQYVESFTCPQQYQRLVIGADGLVMKCSNDEENKEVIGDINSQSVHEVWHGEKMTLIREAHLTGTGFLKSEVCRKCYLPRETRNDKFEVDGRELIVPNYTNRSQIVGLSKFGKKKIKK